MIRNLVSLPLLLASFALATLAIAMPSPASARQQPTCTVNYTLELLNDCPNEQCSLSFPYLVVRKPFCGGCCVKGTASLVCTTGTVNSSVTLCASCGGNNSMNFYCPSDPLVVAEILTVFCKTCP